MKSKHLLLTLLLALVLPWAVNAQTVTKKCYPPTETYATGYTDGTTKTSGEMHAVCSGGVQGWMKFDVSEIPAGTEISSIKLYLYTLSQTNNCYVKATAIGNATGLLDPVTADAADLYEAITTESPSYYINGSNAYMSGFGSTPQWKNFTLTEAAVTNLQETGLANGFFAIGFYEYESGYSTVYQLYAAGYDDETYRPYIEVSYLSTEPYVALAPEEETVLMGGTTTLTATYGNVTGTPTLTFTSSNDRIASVTSDGATATVTGVAEGTATITVTMNYQGREYTATSAITVQEACQPTWSGTGYYISNFSVQGGDLLNNSSTGTASTTTNYYGTQSFTANPGDELSCTITMSSSTTYGFALWVDFDKNGLDANDLIFSTSSYKDSPYTGTLTIPANTPAGEYRVRIWGDYYNSSASDPCGSYARGEAEDYKLIVTIPLFPKPTDLVVSNVTYNSAKLNWTENGTATQWQICVNGDEENLIPVNASQKPYTLDLEENQTYTVKVRSLVGNEHSDWSLPTSFDTPCEPVASTAYTWPENFDSYDGLSSVTASTPNNLPDCWNYINECSYNGGYKVYPVIYNASSYSYSSPNHLRFYSYYYSWSDYDPQDQYAILPPMTDLAGKEIKFMAMGSNTGSVFHVGIMTDPKDKNTFIPLNATAIAPTTSYEQYSFMIPEDVEAQYVAIMMEKANSTTTSRGLYVDNISVKEVITVTADKIVRRVNDPETEMTWAQFAAHVNNGDIFTHETITLMSDLMIGTMVGTSDYPFTGTFDGNGHTLEVEMSAAGTQSAAPFSYIKNANIMNLTVTGTINIDGPTMGAGFALDCRGTNTFTNCVSNVEISSTAGSLGGFIAYNEGGANTTFNGCAFTGSLLLSEGYNGGFCVGNEGILLFNNCVVAPYSATVLETTSATFAYSTSTTSMTLNNCYYAQAIGTAQGKQMLEIYADPESAIEVAMVGEHTDYSESEIQAYATGMVYASKIYAGEGETVTLNLTGSVGGYGATSGTLTASGENFTLTMVGEDAMIYEVTCPAPYGVVASEEDATSAKIAWNGNSDSYKIYYREVITAPVNQELTYNFNDGTSQGWTAVDNDGDGNSWTFTSNYALSTYTPQNSGLNAENWLISPKITLGGTISFDAKQYSNNGNERFQVFVSTTGTDFSDFAAISEVENPSSTYQPYSYDLRRYSGEGYIAIVHTSTAAWAWYVYIDNIVYTNVVAGVYSDWMYETSTASPKVLEDLTPETTYQVQVTGFCSGNETDYSELIEFTTLASCLAPSDLTVTEGSVTAHEASITWVENGSATEWIVEYADNADFEDALTKNVYDEPSFDFPELTGETTYYVRVYARCGDNDVSHPVDLPSFTTLVACPAPTNLYVTENSVTTNEAELNWTKNGNATAWQLFLDDGENSRTIDIDITDVTIEGSLVTYPLTGLRAASHYSVKVRSNCGGIDGESDWSNTETIDTQCDVITVDAENAYDQNFATWVPNCWSLGEAVYGGGSSQNWRLSSEAAYSGYYGPIYLYMPTLNIVGDHASLTFESKETAVNYYTGGTSGNHDGLNIVKVSTDNGTTWTQLWCPTIEELTTYWRTVTINLDGFIGQNILIAFEYQGTDAHGWSIDDVKVALVSEFSKYIEPYETNRGGYYLIASPIAEDITPSVDNGFITDPGSFDLYYFDQAPYDGLEWINFKDEYDGGYDIVNGVGYLYASEDGTLLKFRGTPYEGSGEMLLEMTDDATVDFQGWNLVGNPFAVEAYVSKPYYRMNPEGRAELIPIVSTDEAVEYMEGIFVKADEDGEVINFTTSAPNKKAFLALNLNKDSKVIDRSIVTFGNDERLPKFQLNGKSSKIYLPVEGKDYAIANAESNMGEIPVNFEAKENGTYTLSFANKEVSFAYLHLIDNMTGIETDLLVNPSYSFEARTTDYESRFKLVFATGNNSNEDNFAYYSNGNWVINNDGRATLQLVDVNGRILKSENINGCANVNFNAAAGVYMIRLINGDNVMVQKVVVR